MSRPERQHTNPDPMAPVVLFFDTEYSQRDSAHCAPISLALVARDTGDELYLVLEGGWTPQDCSDFVRANVLPQLHGLDPIVCTAAGAIGAIETFIARLRSDPWQPVQLACDWPMDWDVLMQWLTACRAGALACSLHGPVFGQQIGIPAHAPAGRMPALHDTL